MLIKSDIVLTSITIAPDIVLTSITKAPEDKHRTEI